MNSVNARFHRRSGLVLAAAALALFGLCSAIVQAQPQTQTKAAESAPAISDTVGSVTEPQGDAYVAPKKLSPKLARVTLYRPAHGFSSGVAHLEINGQYHTSLQLGGFSEICLEPEDFKLAAHMVQPAQILKTTKTQPPHSSPKLLKTCMCVCLIKGMAVPH